MPETPKKRERTCIGCGLKSGKSDFIRIVRLATGDVAYDATGRKAGRGAYVCSLKCYEAACRTGKLKKALRMGIKDDQLAHVGEEIVRALSLHEVR